MEKFKVTFYPDNKTVETEKGKTILSAAISAGVFINSTCGGDGVCGKCKIKVKKGEVLAHSSGHINAQEKKQGIYLACATLIQSEMEVEVLPQTRLNLEGLTQEEVSARIHGDYSVPEEISGIKSTGREEFKHLPLTRKICLELPRPTLADRISDLERLERELQAKHGINANRISPVIIKNLSELLRVAEWKVTVTLSKRDLDEEIILVEPGDTSAKNFGICFDVGTTTLSAQLIDFNTKGILGTKATYNKQVAFGSDIISRIVYVRKDGGLQELHSAVAQDLNEMIQELVREHNLDLNDVTCVVCTGNTTMIHLLLRIDPTYIRREPYVPTLNFIPVMRAQEAGLRINPRGLLFCLPGVASYVGADVTAGVLSSGLYKQRDLGVLIDIGTNGEVVVGNFDFLVSCAASAGPAFEGSGVNCGMRAAAGAIQKIRISPQEYEVSYETIGRVKPLGICGSGYIDLLAEMLKAGILDKDGKIKEIRHPRVRNVSSGREYVVVFQKDSASESDIVINEADIDNLKRAKAAIYAALSILFKHLGLDFNQSKNIFIAGGFGTYLDIANAITIGLLPDLDISRFVFLGNTSLAGARQAMLSHEAKEKAGEIARKMTYFELSVEPKYMEEYMAALFFPHTDLSLFPSFIKAKK